MSELLPCPFCGSKNIDAKGWASTDRDGPACDDCGGTADTIELWNSRSAQQERWQPIETIPEDETIVDLWCRNISYGSNDEARFPLMFKNDDGKWEDWHGYVIEPKWRPTHWMMTPVGPSLPSTECGGGK